ncbi:thiol peroxidase [Scenedesmus sp. NREL 46B-D3]|nr:thiol peroxidase [Scenedesmus sp. NREL 46B-D3]
MVKVGDKVPSATLKTMGDSGMQDITTEELTTGKKSHAPGFIQHAADLKAKGVDTIACVSVNDAFVMDAWAKDLAAGSAVLFLADGNGEFTKGMDLEMDGSGFGLGKRSQRYAAVIEDGVITKLEVESGPGLTCSAADNILTLL